MIQRIIFFQSGTRHKSLQLNLGWRFCGFFVLFEWNAKSSSDDEGYNSKWIYGRYERRHISPSIENRIQPKIAICNEEPDIKVSSGI